MKGYMMKIKRISLISGIERERDIPCTQAQLDDYYKNRTPLQRAFPNLSASDREFIKTGIIDEEWHDLFKEDDEYNDFYIGKNR